MLNARMPCPFMVREKVISNRPHPKPATYLPCHSPDLARADQACSLAVEVEPDQAVERKVQLAHAVEGAMYLAVQREQQGNSVLSDRVRRIDGDPRDGELQFSGGGEVHVIEPRTAKRY